MIYFADLGSVSMVATGDHVRAIGWLHPDHAAACRFFVMTHQKCVKASGAPWRTLDGYSLYGNRATARFALPL
jgi:hypothetical protein